jgi:hypothetical protein
MPLSNPTFTIAPGKPDQQAAFQQGLEIDNDVVAGIPQVAQEHPDFRECLPIAATL